MAKKRTKFERLQRNIERLARRDDACREKFMMNDKRPEPLQAETKISSMQQKAAA